MRSELMAVASRCAMTSVVRLRMSFSSASCTSRSLSRIERARGLVQQQDGRILEDGARDGDALLLPARQPRAAFAEEGVVAFRQPADELVRGRGARRGFDLGVAGAGAAVADVLARARAEDHGLLRHETDAARAPRTGPRSAMSTPSMRMRPALGS